MRQAYNGSTWTDDNNKLIAFNLGSDYCAEHEWGIGSLKHRLEIYTPDYPKGDLMDSIKSFLGIDKKLFKFGIESKRVKNSENIFDNLDTAGVIYDHDNKIPFWGIGMTSRYDNNKKYDFKNLRTPYIDESKNSLVGYWCDSEFAVISSNKEHIEQMITAFKNNDVAIWLGGGGAFKNSGLIIAIISKLPEDFIKKMYEEDLDYFNLNKAAYSTGIHKILKEAKCEYFSLKPAWHTEDGIKTDKLTFWLNPSDQGNNAYGWYTVEDLKLWTKGEGPIPKNKKPKDEAGNFLY